MESGSPMWVWNHTCKEQETYEALGLMSLEQLQALPPGEQHWLSPFDDHEGQWLLDTTTKLVTRYDESEIIPLAEWVMRDGVAYPEVY
jgi:hypothetical protein